LTGTLLTFPSHWLEIVLRLALAIAFGACIGWERESEHKPAGLRTHMLVSLGAAVFVMASIQVGDRPSAEATSRVIQGIVAGIGFLGAGEIFSKSSRAAVDSDSEVKVSGLTSAAAIWVSASLGIAAGAGLWFMGVIATLMALLILWGVKKIE
jgi:putative Mg2+ transporter-C (MgtC) family protein